MITYLLDTNSCIALINGNPDNVRRRFGIVTGERARIATSTIVTFELWYGVAKSARQEVNAGRVRAFLGGSIDIVAFAEEDAAAAGLIRAELERQGRTIGAYDTLIAGQAMRHRAILVTANVREFVRVDGLTVEDWTT